MARRLEVDLQMANLFGMKWMNPRHDAQLPASSLTPPFVELDDTKNGRDDGRVYAERLGEREHLVDPEAASALAHERAVGRSHLCTQAI